MTFYVEPNNWTKNIPMSPNKNNVLSVNSDNGLFNFEQMIIKITTEITIFTKNLKCKFALFENFLVFFVS